MQPSPALHAWACAAWALATHTATASGLHPEEKHSTKPLTSEFLACWLATDSSPVAAVCPWKGMAMGSTKALTRHSASAVALHSESTAIFACGLQDGMQEFFHELLWQAHAMDNVGAQPRSLPFLLLPPSFASSPTRLSDDNGGATACSMRPNIVHFPHRTRLRRLLGLPLGDIW